MPLPCTQRVLPNNLLGKKPSHNSTNRHSPTKRKKNKKKYIYTSIDPKQHRAGHKARPQTTEPGHRVHGRGHKKDKRRTRRQEEDTEPSQRGQQEEDKTDNKRRTRPGHRARPQSSRGQENDKRRTRPGHRAGPQRPQSSGARPVSVASSIFLR